MVLLHQDEFHQLYDKVKAKACSMGSEVMFFVAMDTDAMCACKMLTVSAQTLVPTGSRVLQTVSCAANQRPSAGAVQVRSHPVRDTPGGQLHIAADQL